MFLDLSTKISYLGSRIEELVARVLKILTNQDNFSEKHESHTFLLWTDSFMRNIKRKVCRDRPNRKLQLNRGGPRLWYFLEHKGPSFPTNYETIDYKLANFVYNGSITKLSKESLKGAFYYARINQSFPLYLNKEQFDRNFFKDWKKDMTPKNKELVKTFSLCDFGYISAQISEVFDKDTDTEDEEARAASDYESTNESEMPHKILKARRLNFPQTKELNLNFLKKPLDCSRRSKHSWCNVDGRKERLLNYTVDEPGLFIDPNGRYQNLNGKIRKRVRPEDVIINCSKDSKIPIPPRGRKWKKVIHNSRVPWIAAWKDNVTKEWRYIKLHFGKCMERSYEIRFNFDSAREIQYFIQNFRSKYTAGLNSDSQISKELALSAYMIDQMSCIVDESESQIETISCSTLRCRNIKLIPPNRVNILKQDEAEAFNYMVPFNVFNCFKYLLDSKDPEHLLFNQLNPLKECLKWNGFQITPHLLRIYNTSSAFYESFTPEWFANHDLTVVWYRALQKCALVGNFYDRCFLEKIKSFEENLEEAVNTIYELQDQIEKTNCDERTRKLEKKLNRTIIQKVIIQKSLGNLKAQKRCIEAIIISNFVDPRIYLFYIRKIKGNKYKFQDTGIWSRGQQLDFKWALLQTKQSDESTIRKFNWNPISPMQYFYNFDSTKYHYIFKQRL